MSHHYQLFDPLLPASDADAMLRLCERFGPYGMYSQEASEAEIGQGLVQRHDAVHELREDRRALRPSERRPQAGGGAPTTSARSTPTATRSLIDGIEPFLHHEGFVEAARAIHGRPVIETGDRLRQHAGRPARSSPCTPTCRSSAAPTARVLPQWLMVVMHHSGLFDAWRMPIATGVAWFNDCDGGEFAYYPDGAGGAAATLPGHSATRRIMLDTDSVFHGVDRVATPSAELPPLRARHAARVRRRRALGAARRRRRASRATRWDEVRFSISWKAYCFADEAERRAWREHSRRPHARGDPRRLVDRPPRAAAASTATVPADSELALMLIDEYIRFPAAAAA